MAQVITSTRMLNIRKVCWGMLGVIAISAFEPVVWAATPEIEPVVSPTSKLLAADPSFADILKGNSIPTSIRLRELTPEWRAMSTNGQLEIGNFQAFVSLFGGGAFANNYYTKGQTVTIGSETYIVAYSMLSLADRVAPDMQLNLSLLNLKTIGSMSNIRAFNAIAETKVLEKQLASLQVTNLFGGSKPEETPTKEAPVVRPAEVKPPTTVRKKRRTTKKSRRRQIRRTINRNN
ncbi:hypothetical protein [Chamaesiphon polymorphus]|uniref:Uncharacterized protein n=1 Tax=Chamaesiphon polymorphus CCALA 037 TaxID=2107692 RepID=A0A2T1FFT1_9CYAN|nr:hypothetical protein [Chamaesiphon polymorphus]PSB43804.1 hypothetical protein C7B77_25960 [Chamaesiphon polymorphus CCALA 037]